MMTISNETGCRLFDRSLDPFIGEIDRFDAFSEGSGMLLRAMVDELDTPGAATATDRRVAVTASEAMSIGADRSAVRAYIEAAAARFDDPFLSTIVSIKPLGRSVLAA